MKKPVLRVLPAPQPGLGLWGGPVQQQGWQIAAEVAVEFQSLRFLEGLGVVRGVVAPQPLPPMAPAPHPLLQLAAALQLPHAGATQTRGQASQRQGLLALLLAEAPA